MPSVVESTQLVQAHQFKKLLANYGANKDLLTIGAYTRGTDPDLDEAIARYPSLRTFVSQKMTEGASMAESVSNLFETLNQPLPSADANR